ncbi:hypothetical protein OG625_34345 [Streptomyces sp. NBC_01351]|uniref:hypothetical protein n=1 Tax=Streptomyces sp. NBC_01351 TaxID=2903833 RepID=UPI002E332293|nr:hypothetical protein [Streptomyces sp. NBC_01351]
MRSTRIRSAVVSAVLAAMLAAAGGATAQAQTQARVVPPRDHNCLAPDGTNLNTALGIRERIIGPPACREAFAGERWVRSFPSWGTATGSAGAVYPPGYTSEQNPMDDFRSKFLGGRIVNDIGTRRERTYSFGPETIRLLQEQDGVIYAMFASDVLHPLSVGPHTSTVFLRLSAEHCDGLGTVREDNCLPAGENAYTADVPVRFFPRSAG